MLCRLFLSLLLLLFSLLYLVCFLFVRLLLISYVVHCSCLLLSVFFGVIWLIRFIYFFYSTLYPVVVLINTCGLLVVMFFLAWWSCLIVLSLYAISVVVFLSIVLLMFVFVSIVFTLFVHFRLVLFFSSRSRHSRCDASSDVCSFGLVVFLDSYGRHEKTAYEKRWCAEMCGCRSKARRVGKQCQSWWEPNN